MVIIVGKGKSGIAAAELLGKKGIQYEITDTEHTPDLKDVTYAVISPGVRFDTPLIKKIQQQNIPVISEIELAFRHSPAPVLAVTGTNGKSTTVSLLHSILCREGYNSRLLGNIGTAFCAEALDLTATDVVTLEASSFQLNAIENFHPKIACILNITPDHLDYHGSMEEYARAKFNITINQNENDYLVLSADDIPCEYLKMLDSRAKITFFSVTQKVNGAYVFKDAIYFQDEYIMKVSDIKLLGAHNVSNTLAAICMAKHYGVGNAAIQQAVSEFTALPHRLQFAGIYQNKKYYNDSKATNTDSVLCDIKAFDTSTALLVGGSDKGVEYDALFLGLHKNITEVIAYGFTAEKFVAAAQRNNYDKIIRVNTVKEAMEAAGKTECENVLLAPCCASFDQYNDYRERGDDFINIINEWSSEEKQR